MKGLRIEQRESRLLKAIEDGDDAAAQILENSILKKGKKNSIKR